GSAPTFSAITTTRAARSSPTSTCARSTSRHSSAACGGGEVGDAGSGNVGDAGAGDVNDVGAGLGSAAGAAQETQRASEAASVAARLRGMQLIGALYAWGRREGRASAPRKALVPRGTDGGCSETRRL